MSKGYYYDIEAYSEDRFLDVFASDEDGRRIGIQVVTGELDAYEFMGIRKAVLAGLDLVVVACETEGVRNKVETKLAYKLQNCGYDNGVAVPFVDLVNSRLASWSD